jgi:hypothetical protein
MVEFHKINLQNILDIQQNYYFYISGNIALLVTYITASMDDYETFNQKLF